jgi:prevent-host-death family protein
MKSVSVTNLKARLSEFLRGVKRGAEIVVVERGRPIAKLVPLHPRGSERDAREELVRLGLLRPGRGPLPARFWKERPRVRDPKGSVLKGLLEERDAGR